LLLATSLAGQTVGADARTAQMQLPWGRRRK
jgi:hypothetical protein